MFSVLPVHFLRKSCRLIPAKDEGVKYACNQCDHQFTQQGSLSKHIQSVHEGVKYACNQCDHHYTQQGNLTKHIQSVHEGVNYNCSQCDYKAKQKTHLNAHIEAIMKVWSKLVISVTIKLHNREIWQNISKLKMMNNIFPHLSYLWQGKAGKVGEEDDCGQTVHQCLTAPLEITSFD